jgi:hypothetical protein
MYKIFSVFINLFVCADLILRTKQLPTSWKNVGREGWHNVIGLVRLECPLRLRLFRSASQIGCMFNMFVLSNSLTRGDSVQNSRHLLPQIIPYSKITLIQLRHMLY